MRCCYFARSMTRACRALVASGLGGGLRLLAPAAWSQPTATATPPAPAPPAAPVATPSPPPAVAPSSAPPSSGEPPGPPPRPIASGFQAAFRTGVLFPFGDASGRSSDSLGRRYAWQIPFVVDLG